MKSYMAKIKIVETKKVFIKAASAEAAQRILSDNKTTKVVRPVDMEISYGDVKEIADKDFPKIGRITKAKKKA